MDLSVACNVEMIADVAESPVEDVIQSAGFRRKGFPLRRGTAMMIISVIVLISLHTALHSEHTPYGGGDSNDNFENQAPYGAA